MNDSRHTVLAVDDEAAIREIARRSLERRGYSVTTAGSVEEARRSIATSGPFDLVLADINMPGEKGTQLLMDLAPRSPDTVVVMATAVQDVHTAVNALRAGAYDYVIKPFDMDTLQVTVDRAMERRDLQIQARRHKVELEDLVESRSRELVIRSAELADTQRALLRAMCHLAEFRDNETGQHLERMTHYSRIVAEHLRGHSCYAAEISEAFIRTIFDAAPLHDIGKIGIPDAVLAKPGKHTPEERVIMQRHPIIGRDALWSVKKNLPQGTDQTFIDMAIEVAAFHHERFDGKGYPFGLKGTEIPLVARIVAVADYYDACSSSRVYRPEPIAHPDVMDMMINERGGLFDPVVLDAFVQAEALVLQTREELQD